MVMSTSSDRQPPWDPRNEWLTEDLVEMEEKEVLVEKVGMDLGLVLLPWLQLGKMAAEKYHTDSCCEPCGCNPARPSLHPRSSSPSNSPCHLYHSQQRALRDPSWFHKQSCRGYHQSRAGRRSCLPRWQQRLAAWRQLLAARSHPWKERQCGL